MKRMILVISFALVSTLSAAAQGKSQSAPANAAHSNAPGSTDRDKGTERATDVGKGQKKGLKKSKKDKDKKGNTTSAKK
jgi:hypothetical protein